MQIQITKRPDGSGVLRCLRGDGSQTWQKQERHAPFFALHDLTHFAVETTLHFRRGFFGLLAEGWSIEDTTGKGERGPLPPEAMLVEGIVGLFDAERASGVIWTAQEFNQFAGIQTVKNPLDEQVIRRIRARRSELFTQWLDVPAGGTLELSFPENLNLVPSGAPPAVPAEKHRARQRHKKTV